MKKRIFAFVLSLCIIFSMVPVIGTSAVGTEAKISSNSSDYQKKAQTRQYQSIQLGIDTTKGSWGGMNTANSDKRFVIFLTGLSGYSNWNENQTLDINGTEHTAAGKDNQFYYDASGYGSQTLWFYYDFLKSGATLADQVPKTTISIPAGTVFGNYITENTLTFTLDGYSMTVDSTTDQNQPSNKVNFTLSGNSTWQYSDNRYLVYLDHDLGKDLPVAWAPLNVLSMDGKDVSVYALGGSQLMLVLDSTVGITQMSEHSFTLKKGTFIGDYEIANDVTFYTHADGTVDGASSSKTVNFTLSGNSTWQYSDNRYLVYFDHDLGKDIPVAWAPLNVLSMDGKDVSVYALGGSQIMMILDSTVGITKMGEHSFTLKKGTFIGDYEIANDVTFYTHADGTVNQELPTAPVDFRFSQGVWQVSDSRYLVWLESDITGELTVPWSPLEGITINGEKATVYAVVDSGKVMLILDKAAGIANPGKYTVTLKQGTYIGKYEIARDITFYTDGLTVSAEAPAQIPEPSETVTVENDSRNLNGTCKDYFYFQVSPADALPYDEKNETARYGAAKGGIYVNGELTQITITKLLSNLYYVPLNMFGYPPQKGDVVTIDGVFGNGEHAVTYQKQSFVYDGEGNWEIGTYLRDLREQEYIVQDISELKMGLSQFDLVPGETLIGDAKRGTNIAIRTVVSTGLETDEFNFGFSKINGMWDVETSGWQVWLRPQWNQVFLAHGASDWQVTGHYEFTKEEFTVEFGTVNVHEYIDGKDVGLYCRKIFLKIDGVEVLSYKDTNLNRNVGKKLYVYTSKDSEGSKLISLTSKGVTLRELTPKIYDYYDLSGFATDTVAGGSTACLGETASSTNVAVRMKIDLSTNATEVRLALSKQQKDNFWDTAGSGWQLWLRPKWDMLYIAHGENEYEVITNHPYRSSFTLEFGVRDVVLEKDGKYISTYCRKVYVLIDGQEVAAWEDTDFSRKLGKCVMMLTSLDSEAKVSTLKKTATLPVQTFVNGEAVENCEFVKLEPKVVVGKDSKIAVIYSSDAAHKTTFGGLYCNGEKLEPLEENDGKVTYLLKAPSADDQLKVELTVKQLTTDEPTAVFDLFDLTGKSSLEVPARTTVSIGALINQDGQGSANTAVRFAIRLPKVFNAAQITILGDVDNPWSTSGAMLQIVSNQINLCYPAMVRRMDSFASSLFVPGSLACVEFGIVKCYENGVYKYDRWYVKAGKTVDTMELIGWYDSMERGHYGAHFSCHGNDLDESYYLYSLKDIFSVTDASTDENKALLRTYTQLRNSLPELYYPDALVGYSTLEQAEQAGRIALYTKPGTKLSRLTVNGEQVQFAVGTDGAYFYTLPSVTENVQFAYEITEDNTRYSVTASGDDKLHFSIPEDGVLAGDDLRFTVIAQKGYMPKVTANGTELLLTLNEETGVWQGIVKSIRQDTQIEGTAVERSYTVSVNAPDHGTVTLGGDVLDGKLPFGGRLEIALQPDSGYYIQSVTVNGVEVPVNEDLAAVLSTVYLDTESITVEAVFVQANVADVEQTQSGMTYIWIGLAVLAVAAAAVAVLLRKRKPKEGNEAV